MKRSKQGVALMLTLVVAFFLVVLLGAFMVVHHSNNSLTVGGLKRQQAYNACLTGLHFVWGELEQNQAWGAGGFPAGETTRSLPRDGAPRVTFTMHGDPDNPEDLGANYLEGEVPGTGQTFKIKLVNNISNRNVMEDTELGDVPGRCVKLRVEGQYGGIGTELESVLRMRPFVDYSALSARDMTIDLNDYGYEPFWVIRSQDPYINQVRSNVTIDGPSALDNELTFRGPPRGGIAKATTDIVLDGTSVKDDPDFLEASQAAAEGTFEVGSPNVEIPGLAQEDLQFPENVVPIPQGSLTIRPLEKHEWSSRDFEVDTDYPPDGNPDTTITRWRLVKKTYQALDHNGTLHVSQSHRSEDSGPLNLPTDGFGSPTSPAGFQDVPSQPTQFNDFPVLFGTDDTHRMRANLTNGEITLTSGTKFQVDGSLQIKNEPGGLQPNLKFGYDMNDNGDTTFTGGEDGLAALENPEAYSAALVTNEGSLQIEGTTSGFGSIYADSAVSLQAKRGLRAEPDLAVAVHGNSIHLSAEEKPSGITEGDYLKADWEAFQTAMAQGSFEEWADTSVVRRRSIVGDDHTVDRGLRTVSMGKSASYFWDLLGEDMDLPDNPPNLGSDWSGNLSLEQYIRLRNFADTGSSAYLQLSGDPPPKFTEIVSDIDQQIMSYVQWAERMDQSVEDFMANDKPTVVDAYFVGLVHAGPGGFLAESDGASMLFEGALVSQGRVLVEETNGLHFVYNRLYLDDVVKKYRGDHIDLDQVYFKVR